MGTTTRKDFQDRWAEAAEAVFAALGGTSRDARMSTAVAMLSEVGGFGDTWTSALTAAGTKLFSAETSFAMGRMGTFGPLAARLGFALAARDATAIHAGEAVSLRERGIEVAWRPVPASPPPAGPSFQATFSYVYDALPPGGRSRPVTHAATDGVVSVGRMDRSEASTAWTLPTPAGWGLDVLGLPDGTYLRPLLAPGEWRPVGEAEFVEAAATGGPWVDSPFVPDGASGCAVAVPDLSFRKAGKHAPPRKADALAKALAAADGMVSIDGVVHVRTEAPTLSVDVVLSQADGPVVASWALGRLRSTQSQDVFLPDRRPVGVADLFAWPATLPVGEVEAARKAARRVAERFGRRLLKEDLLPAPGTGAETTRSLEASIRNADRSLRADEVGALRKTLSSVAGSIEQGDVEDVPGTVAASRGLVGEGAGFVEAYVGALLGLYAEALADEPDLDMEEAACFAP